MAQTLRPVSTSPIANEQQFSDQFVRESGIVLDFDGTGLRVTSDGSSTTVTVAVGQLLLEGLTYVNDVAVPVALGTLGVQPAAGQSRLSWIVVRLTKSGSPWSAAVTAITGTPGASPSTPALGADDFPLALVTQSGTSAITQSQIVDHRTWLSRSVFISSAGSFGAEPVGAIGTRSNNIYQRRWVPSGSSGSVQTVDLLAAGAAAAAADVDALEAGLLAQRPRTNGAAILDGLRAQDSALTGVVTVPGISVPYRVVLTVSARMGDAASARELYIGHDSTTAASVVVQPADPVDVPAGQRATVTYQAIFNQAANTDVTFRLMQRGNGNAFCSGIYSWVQTRQ